MKLEVFSGDSVLSKYNGQMLEVDKSHISHVTGTLVIMFKDIGAQFTLSDLKSLTVKQVEELISTSPVV